MLGSDRETTRVRVLTALLVLVALCAGSLLALRGAPPSDVTEGDRAPGTSAVTDAESSVGEREPVPAEIPPGDLEILVRGDGPLPGARVEVVDALGGEHQAFTDARGSALFRRIAAGSAIVNVHADGFLPAEEEAWVSPSGSRRWSVDLVPPRALRGRVVREADRAPVVGARIRSLDVNLRMEIRSRAIGEPTCYDVERVLEETTSGPDGEFALTAVPSRPTWGAAPLVVSAPGYRTAWFFARRTEPDEPEPVFELPLVRGGRIAGSVRRTDGTPAGGVRVQAIPHEVADWLGPDQVGGRLWPVQDALELWGGAVATVAADGTFSLEGVPIGQTLDLVLGAEGFESQKHESALRLTRKLPEARIDLEFAAHPAPPRPVPPPTRPEPSPARPHLDVLVTGRVVDDRGRGIPRAEIRPVGHRFWWETDVDGSFRARGLAPGPHVAWVSAEHCAKQRVEIHAPGEDQTIVLRRTSGVWATLVLPPGADGGHLIAPGSHHHRWSDEALVSRWTLAVEPSWGRPLDPDEREMLEAFCPEEIPVLEASIGRWTLRALLPGVGWLERTLMRQPEPIDLGDLTLEPGFPLRILVEDEDGAPVPWASLSIDQAGWGYREHGRTGKDGSFTTPALAPDRVQVDVGARGFLPGEGALALREGGPPLRIVLRRGIRLRVVVLDAEGHRVPGAELALEDEDLCDATGPSGTIEHLLPAGTYRLRATADEGRLEGEAEVRLDRHEPFARVVVTVR
jgi:hypothetical protein